MVKSRLWIPILDALAPGSPRPLQPLRIYARKEIAQVRTLRTWFASLPSTGRSVSFLRKGLNNQVVQGETRLIKIIGLLAALKRWNWCAKT